MLVFVDFTVNPKGGRRRPKPLWRQGMPKSGMPKSGIVKTQRLVSARRLTLDIAK